MEKINVVEDSTPAVIVLHTMMHHEALIKQDMRTLFNIPKGSEVSVELRVNGVEVDVMATLTEIWERENKRIEERAKVMAVSMVTAAGLDGVRETLDNVEWQIKEALMKAGINPEE